MRLAESVLIESIQISWKSFVAGFFFIAFLQGNLDAQTESSGASGEKVELADLFTGENVATLAREDMEALAKGEKRDKSSLVVLYAPWCSFSQAMNDSYNAVADKLAGSNVVVSGQRKP